METIRLQPFMCLWGMLCCVPMSHAQVSVAPVAVFMDDTNRFGTFYVSNQTGTPQEVELDFRFGYPAADSLGNVFMQYADSAAAEQYSIAPYMRSFPRQFVLQPGESQVVRLTTRLPQQHPPGYYWTRLITTSTPQATFADTTTTGVQAQIVFRVQQVTAVFFKRGNPATALALRDVEAAADTNAVFISAYFERGAETPFLGRVTIAIKDEQGTLVGHYGESISAYFSIWRRFEIEVPKKLKGTYTATMTLTSDRSDIPEAYQTVISPIVETVAFKE